MKNILVSFALLITAAALLAGCGAVRESHYYQLGGLKENLRPAVGALLDWVMAIAVTTCGM